MNLRATITLSVVAAAAFSTVAAAAVVIGPFTRTTDAAQNNAEVGNRLALWAEGEYYAGGHKDSKAVAHVKHVEGNRFIFDGVIAFADGSVQTLCKVPATEIAMEANLNDGGALNSYQGAAKNQDCTVSAGLSGMGELSFGVSECESFCVGGSREGGHSYMNADIQKKYRTTIQSLKESTGDALEAELAKKQAASAAAK